MADGRGVRSEMTAPRADRHRHVLRVVRRRAQQEHRALRWFLDGLQQGVGRALGQPVGVVDDHDLPAATGRPAGGGLHQRAHLRDGDGQAFRDDDADVGVRPAIVVRQPGHSPQPGRSSRALQRRGERPAATERPEPGGPVNSHACVIAPWSRRCRPRRSSRRHLRRRCETSTAAGWPTTSAPDARSQVLSATAWRGLDGRGVAAQQLASRTAPSHGRASAHLVLGAVRVDHDVAVRVGRRPSRSAAAAPANGARSIAGDRLAEDGLVERVGGIVTGARSSRIVTSGRSLPVAQSARPFQLGRADAADRALKWASGLSTNRSITTSAPASSAGPDLAVRRCRPARRRPPARGPGRPASSHRGQHRCAAAVRRASGSLASSDVVSRRRAARRPACGPGWRCRGGCRPPRRSARPLVRRGLPRMAASRSERIGSHAPVVHLPVGDHADQAASSPAPNSTGRVPSIVIGWSNTMMRARLDDSPTSSGVSDRRAGQDDLHQGLDDRVDPAADRVLDLVPMIVTPVRNATPAQRADHHHREQRDPQVRARARRHDSEARAARSRCRTAGCAVAAGRASAPTAMPVASPTKTATNSRPNVASPPQQAVRVRAWRSRSPRRPRRTRRSCRSPGRAPAACVRTNASPSRIMAPKPPIFFSASCLRSLRGTVVVSRRTARGSGWRRGSRWPGRAGR